MGVDYRCGTTGSTKREDPAAGGVFSLRGVRKGAPNRRRLSLGVLCNYHRSEKGRNQGPAQCNKGLLIAADICEDNKAQSKAFPKPA